MTLPSWKAIIAAVTVTLGVLVGSVVIAGSGDSLERNPPGGPLQTDRLDDTVEYTVEDGATASDVAKDLQILGVIRSARQFESLVRLMGVGDNLSAGEHVFHLNSSASEVVDMLLVRPGPPQIKVTFPEGIRIEEMGKILEDAGIGLADQFVFAAQNAQLPPALAEGHPPNDLLPPNQALQGYLFPDTYYVAVDSTPADLVRRMIEEMNDRFDADLRAKAAARGLSVHEVLTLASIVEREAVLPEERPIIAGVFFNRLKAGDLLGADPTVQFAVSLDPDSVKEYGYWKTELTFDDLQTDSPYNTRRFPGMPPGPITNPSLDSIKAVVEPADTDYYYFVANALKGDGSHVFAETEAEHDANKAIYGAPPQ